MNFRSKPCIRIDIDFGEGAGRELATAFSGWLIAGRIHATKVIPRLSGRPDQCHVSTEDAEKVEDWLVKHDINKVDQ